MATAETVELNEAHEPKEESIKAFESIEADLKHILVHLRHTHDKHEPQYFAAVKQLGDQDLTAFGPQDFVQVRVANSAYGLHLIGKLRIAALPETEPGFVHFRVFVAQGAPPKLHSIHTEETEGPDGQKTFRAVFGKDDQLEWFDS